MVSTRLLPEWQREEVTVYLREKPIRMPSTVRQIRSKLLRNIVDLDQIEEDLKLLRELKGLEVSTGRPTDSERDMRAEFTLRRKTDKDIRATMQVKR